MRVPSTGRRLYSSLMFVLVSVIGGVLLAGLFVPAAGIAGESSKAVAVSLNSLPEELKVGPPTEGSKVVMGDGKTTLTTFFDQFRKNVTLDEVAPIMRAAQVGIEDDRFYEHGALDIKGTLRALVRSGTGSTQGGSTLTQQYVKLALLYDAEARKDVDAQEAAQNRTVSRKILELRYAVALEQQLTKDQILERYLNIAYYGDGAYGIEAAAQHFFGVPAKKLSLPQAAMLAGIVRNPHTTNPVNSPALATERMRNVLTRLAEPSVGVITAEQAAKAKKYKFDEGNVRSNPTRGCVTSDYPHLCDYVTNVLKSQTSSLGSNETERTNTLKRGGLTIQIYTKPTIQKATQKAVSDLVLPTDPVNATMTIIQPGTGVIMGMAQSKYAMGSNKKAGETWLNFAAPNAMNGSGGSEGGSTFKAFTVTAALQAGLDPRNHYINSPLTYTFPVGTNFGGCTGGDRDPAIVAPKPWVVRQAGRTGNMNMYLGATYSSNTFFTQLEKQVGVCNVAKAAKAVGLQRADGADLVTGVRPSDGKLTTDINPGDYIDGDKKTLTLGNTKVTPISLANSYATFAARGMRCDPIIVKSIKDESNRSYKVPEANCEQTIPQDVADRVADILHGPFSSFGTAAAARIQGYLISGKTGTQTKAPTVLTAGFTPDAAGVAILNSDPFSAAGKAQAKRYGEALPRLAGLVIHSRKYGTRVLGGSSGREAGGMLWKPAMEKVLPMLPKTQFVRPPDSPYAGATTNFSIGNPGGYLKSTTKKKKSTTNTTTSTPATAKPKPGNR